MTSVYVCYGWEQGHVLGQILLDIETCCLMDELRSSVTSGCVYVFFIFTYDNM